MCNALVKIFAGLCFFTFFMILNTPAVKAADDVNALSVKAPLRSEKEPPVLLSPPKGQRHIVLLNPIAPRSMPRAVLESIKDRMESDFHVPLNDTLEAVTYADAEEVLEAMAIIYGGDGSLSERIRTAAEKTNADYIAGIAVTDYKESTYLNWKEELVLHSYVSLHLVGYDRVRDLVFDLPAVRSYHSSYTVSGTARILLFFEIDRLMDQADFRSTLFPISAWLDKPREKS